MDLDHNILTCMVVLLDEELKLKVILWIVKETDRYGTIISTKDAEYKIDKHMFNLEDVISYIKDLALRYKAKYYMPHAHLYNMSYALKGLAMLVSDFTFESFSSSAKNLAMKVDFSDVKSIIKNLDVIVVNNYTGFRTITGKMFDFKIAYGFSLLNIDLIDSYITPICIGQCFAYELGIRCTIIYIILDSGKKLKWTFDLDIKSALVEAKDSIMKLGCTHIIPGNYFYIGNTKQTYSRLPGIISMPSFLFEYKESDYVKLLISNIEAEMMYVQDYRIKIYVSTVVNQLLSNFPSVLRVVLGISEVNLFIYMENSKIKWLFNVVENGKYVPLYLVEEDTEMSIYKNIRELKFGDYSFKKFPTKYQNTEILDKIMSIYRHPKLEACKCADSHDSPGCLVVNLSLLDGDMIGSFIMVNFYYKCGKNEFDKLIKKPLCCEYSESKNYGYNQLSSSLNNSKKKIQSRFSFGFDNAGKVKLNCYSEKTPMNFMKILNHRMKFDRKSTILYSDAGILAAEIFLTYVAKLDPSLTSEIEKCIEFDKVHDALKKTVFAINYSNSFIDEGSIVIKVWERDTFRFLCKMPRVYKVLYNTFYERFIFIAHAWLCCSISIKPDSAEFKEFLSEYDSYIKSLRDMMSYCFRLYVDVDVDVDVE